MVARSDKMKQLFTLVRKVAPSDASVLILGENGTGKELVASALHQNSKRAKGPFIKINCAAIPSELIESELFGHKRGSFTGALADRPGVIELADGGSLLLDEIGEMPAALQAKLLRVLQEREFTPVGSTRPIKSDFRLICATNINLDAALADKKLRQDLYFRINTFTLAIPALRERTTDIPLLAEYFLERYAARHQRRVTGIHPDAMRMLQRHRWPGNVRELEHAIERAVIVATEAQIQVADLPATLRDAEPDMATRRRVSRASHARGDRADGDSAHARADAVEQARGGHHSRRLPADAVQQAEEVQPVEAAGAARRADQLTAGTHRRPHVERPTRHSDRTSDAFIRQVAHDLRASLNVVVSWAELVKAGQLPPDDVSRAGETIVRHARHLSERLGVALDLWRLDSGLLAPSMRVVSIGAVVRAAVEDARRLFDSRRVSCRLDVRGDGSASVDAPRLAQALVVLLGDAAANTPPDQSVEVTVDADGAQVVIAHRRGGLMPDQAAFDRKRGGHQRQRPEAPVRLRARAGQGARRAQRRRARRRAGRRRSRGDDRAAAATPIRNTRRRHDVVACRQFSAINKCDGARSLTGWAASPRGRPGCRRRRCSRSTSRTRTSRPASHQPPTRPALAARGRATAW